MDIKGYTNGQLEDIASLYASGQAPLVMDMQSQCLGRSSTTSSAAGITRHLCEVDTVGSRSMMSCRLMYTSDSFPEGWH
jgi:hypothetical protein